MSVEGMRKGVSARASDGALLQRGVPAESETVVAMEKPATVAAVGEWAEEAEATKRPSSRTAADSWTCIIAAGKCGAWVITSRVS
jgi:hypothetical protein